MQKSVFAALSVASLSILHPTLDCFNCTVFSPPRTFASTTPCLGASGSQPFHFLLATSSSSRPCFKTQSCLFSWMPTSHVHLTASAPCGCQEDSWTNEHSYKSTEFWCHIFCGKLESMSLFLLLKGYRFLEEFMIFLLVLNFLLPPPLSIPPPSLFFLILLHSFLLFFLIAKMVYRASYTPHSLYQ